jgi:cold shock CspA family protein
MQSIEFIKNKLGEIANRFPTVQIKYAFNSNIETHIIQFEPFDAYYNMPELDAAWIPFSVEFDRIYQDESIAFIGSDSTLSITDNFDFSWNTQLIDLTIQGFKELLGDTDFRGSFNSFPKTVIWTPSVLPDYNFVINPFDIILIYLSDNTYIETRVLNVYKQNGLLHVGLDISLSTTVKNELANQLYTRLLVLSRKADETNVILSFTKRDGKTSYGFLIPENVSSDVLANIDTITREVKQKLLNDQAVINDINGGSF